MATKIEGYLYEWIVESEGERYILAVIVPQEEELGEARSIACETAVEIYTNRDASPSQLEDMLKAILHTIHIHGPIDNGLFYLVGPES